jgi:hypothetical protein
MDASFATRICVYGQDDSGPAVFAGAPSTNVPTGSLGLQLQALAVLCFTLLACDSSCILRILSCTAYGTSYHPCLVSCSFGCAIALVTVLEPCPLFLEVHLKAVRTAWKPMLCCVYANVQMVNLSSELHCSRKHATALWLLTQTRACAQQVPSGCGGAKEAEQQEL